MSCLALGLPATTLQQSFPSSHPDISAERLLFSLAVENDSQAKFLTTKQFHALKQMSDPLFRDVKYSVESLLFSLAVENDSQATDLYLKTTPKQHNKACHTADGLLCLENTSTHHPASPSKKPSSQSPPPNQRKTIQDTSFWDTGNYKQVYPYEDTFIPPFGIKESNPPSRTHLQTSFPQNTSRKLYEKR